MVRVLLRAHPCSGQGEDAPGRVLPGLTSYAVLLRQAPELRFQLLRLAHPLRQAAIGDRRSDCALLRHPAKAERSLLRWFALEASGLPPEQDVAGLRTPPGFVARS